MKTKLKVLTGLVLLIFLTTSLTLVALAETSTQDEALFNHEEVSLAPGGIGLLASFGVVTTTDASDAIPGDGKCESTLAGKECTLRAAIEEANVLGGSDTINLPSNTYTLDFGQLVISTDVIIAGGGSGSTIIDGNRTVTHDRIFRILSSGNASISGVTITNGEEGKGGAIENLGTLLLDDVIVSNSEATGNGGGGIINDGGIFGVGATLTVFNSTITGNTARGGGGIHNQNGTITISNTIISNNTSTAPVGNLGIGVGGGISNVAREDDSTVTIYQSTITGNTAEGTGGGGINNSASLTDTTATLILNQTVVSGNHADPKNVSSVTGFGGGIRNGFADPANGNTSAILTVNDSIISGNEAVNGAGIGSGTTSTTNTLTLKATLNNSTVSSNTTTYQTGGALEGSGGGLVNVNGTMTLVNSTVSGNSATGTNATGGQGGGIFNGDLSKAATLWLTNTTISNNTAQNSSKGDGVANIENTDTTANFKNSIIDGGCFNFNGTLTSHDNNLDDDDSCSLTQPNDIPNGTPALGSLKNNGGPTPGATGATAPMLTHALQDGSDALGNGDSATCSAPPVNGKDQLGVIRPQGDPACDIGAYESDLTSGSGNDVYLPIVIKP